MKRTSIRLRLMLLMICLTTLPVIIMTWIATINTTNSVEQEIINANTSRMMWADQYLDELMQQIDALFYTLQINQALITSLSATDSPDLGVQFRTQQYIHDTLTSAFHANERKVDELTLYSHQNHKAFSVNFAGSGVISQLDISSGAWSRMRSTPIHLYFKQQPDGIYAFHSINRFEDRQLVAGLSARIDRDVWKATSDILKSESESSVFLVNDEGELLSGSTTTQDSREIQAQLRRLDVQHADLEIHRTQNYVFFLKRIGDGQLTLLKAIPMATINRSARSTIWAGIWTGILFAVASVLLSILVSLRITGPIVSLARTMRKAKLQNFELKPVQNDFDEIGLLQHGYNSLMQRIKELIEVEYQQEIQVKDAQLKALQAQINPHFLNNTLNLIGGMALANQVPQIYEITRVIGDLLRYSISTGGDMVSLQDELQHVRNYVFIQEQRFAGRCKVTLTSDEAALESRLPKFTLQPIVENAFEHGLQRQQGSWNVEVRIKRIGNRVVLLVKDEGVGLPAERLQQLRAELQGGLSREVGRPGLDSQRKGRGIGLRNVQARLKLQFGDRYGLRIFSNLGAGTLVVIVLPVSTTGVGERA